MNMLYRALLPLVLMLSLFLSSPATSQEKQAKLLIGLIPEMNVFKQKERFKLLGEYLSKKTGLPVEFTMLSRYGNILDRFKSERMDGAFFGSFTGALAVRNLGVIPLARPVNLDDTSTYRGYLIVRKNSGIRKAEDMRGKKMVFVEKATTAGYLFPLAYLRQNGITDSGHFFSESYFAGSHDAAIKAVLNGEADIGAVKHSMYDRVGRKDARVERDLMVIAKSPAVPSNGLCVRKDLDPALQAKLKESLLTLHLDAEGRQALKEFGAVRFIETAAGDYRPVFDLVTKAGIDINTYNYRNE